MNIYQKLIEVRKEVPYLQKADQGAQYSYTGSSRVLAACKRKMDEMGLLLIPGITGTNVRESTVEVKDANGNITKRTTTFFTELEMTMTWINAEKPDETISSPWYAQGVDIAGEKGVGKALTYGEKYFLLKFFNIATDKDDPDAFQQKHDLVDMITAQQVGLIKTKWLTLGYKEPALAPQLKTLYKKELAQLTEDQAKEFLAKLEEKSKEKEKESA